MIIFKKKTKIRFNSFKKLKVIANYLIKDKPNPTNKQNITKNFKNLNKKNNKNLNKQIIQKWQSIFGQIKNKFIMNKFNNQNIMNMMYLGRMNKFIQRKIKTIFKVQIGLGKNSLK